MDPSQQSDGSFLPTSSRPIFLKPSEFYSSSLSVIYEYGTDEEGNIMDESGNVVSNINIIYTRKPKVGDERCMSVIRLDEYIDDSSSSQSLASFESDEVEEKEIDLESEVTAENCDEKEQLASDFDSSTSSTLTPVTDNSQDSQDSQTE